MMTLPDTLELDAHEMRNVCDICERWAFLSVVVAAATEGAWSLARNDLVTTGHQIRVEHNWIE
jgi:hypothetical protein